MSEADPVVPTPPPATVGERLRFAREAQGLALDEVAARTRVPLRHLSAIERGDYSALPSVTYAVGFVRAYARVVGQDEVALSRDARVEVDRTVRPVKPYEPYAMADPARVPSRGLVIAATGIALAVLVLAILWLGTGMMRSDTAPATGAPTAPVVAAVPAVQPRPAQPTGGQVRLTATDEVWMRVYDAKNGTLYLGTMKPGETFDVPPAAEDPMINVGRPDKLTVTLNGSAVPPLGTGERAIKDVRIGGAAIAARLAGTPEPATAAPAVTAPRTSQSDASVPPAFRQPSPSATSPSVDAGGAQTPPGVSAPTTDAGDAAQ